MAEVMDHNIRGRKLEAQRMNGRIYQFMHSPNVVYFRMAAEQSADGKVRAAPSPFRPRIRGVVRHDRSCMSA